MSCQNEAVMPSKIIIPRYWQRGKIERNLQICQSYVSEKYRTEQIAKFHQLTPRAVQKIVGQAGIVRTRAEGNRVASPLKSKRRLRSSYQRTGQVRTGVV